MWTQRHHIGAMKIIGCCLFMLDFSDCLDDHCHTEILRYPRKADDFFFDERRIL